MAHSHSEHTGELLGIAALSAGIGALAALLFTPRTGEQVRHGIGRRTRYAKDSMMDKLHSTSNDMSESMDDAKRTAETKAKDKIAGAANKTKSIADKTKNKADR